MPFAFAINLLFQGVVISLFTTISYQFLIVIFFRLSLVSRHLICDPPLFQNVKELLICSNTHKKFYKTKLDEALTLPYGIDRSTRNLGNVP